MVTLSLIISMFGFTLILALNDCISVMFSVITVSNMLKLTVLSEIRFNPEDEGEEDICLANKLS